MAAPVNLLLGLRKTVSFCFQNTRSFAKCCSSLHSVMKIYTNNLCRSRCFSTTPQKSLKEIHWTTDGDITVVEGVQVKSAREGLVIDVEDPHGSCGLCKLNLNLKYTDVLILSQFLRPDGCVLPRRVTGLCMKQHKKIMKLVNQAQRAGLMPTLRPPGWDGKPKSHMKSPYKWKKYNCYFE